VAKVGQGRPNSKDCSYCPTSAILPTMNVLAQVIGVVEPKNRKAGLGQGVSTFCEGQGHICHLPCIRSFRAVWLCTITSL